MCVLYVLSTTAEIIRKKIKIYARRYLIYGYRSVGIDVLMCASEQLGFVQYCVCSEASIVIHIYQHCRCQCCCCCCCCYSFCCTWLLITCDISCEWVISFLTAHQHTISLFGAIHIGVLSVIYNDSNVGVVKPRLRGTIKITSSSDIAERPRDARVTSIRKIASGIFEPPFAGALRGNIDASCVRRWKKRGRLPGDNWTF